MDVYIPQPHTHTHDLRIIHTHHTHHGFMLKSTVGCGSFGSHAAQRQRKALSRWSLLGSSSGALCDWLSVCLCAVSVCVFVVNVMIGCVWLSMLMAHSNSYANDAHGKCSSDTLEINVFIYLRSL